MMREDVSPPRPRRCRPAGPHGTSRGGWWLVIRHLCTYWLASQRVKASKWTEEWESSASSQWAGNSYCETVIYFCCGTHQCTCALHSALLWSINITSAQCPWDGDNSPPFPAFMSHPPTPPPLLWISLLPPTSNSHAHTHEQPTSFLLEFHPSSSPPKQILNT